MSLFGKGDAFDLYVLSEVSEESKNQGGCMLSLFILSLVPILAIVAIVRLA